MERIHTTAIVLAAGRGRRMPGQIPKQYRPMAGKPILLHTLACFVNHPRVDRIVLVVNPEDEDYCRRLLANQTDVQKLAPLVAGGRERIDSVAAGIEALDKGSEIVMVHDAVRPFVVADLIDRILDAVTVGHSVIPAVPVTDTIKEVIGGRVVSTPERSSLWSAQTPQAFFRDILEEAVASRDRALGATDEAVLLERAGVPVHIVEGDYNNMKITAPTDLDRAEAILRRGTSVSPKRMRVGQGFDVHRLVAGRELVLGGVCIPFEAGLAGHSDADVLTHAIIDALLGAVAGGDIGQLFPDHDPQFEGISSLVLLERVRQSLFDKRAQIQHIDAVVLAQRPKLVPHIPAMCKQLAMVLGVSSDVVSVKATTTERLGFVGREDGMAAQAVALVEA